MGLEHERTSLFCFSFRKQHTHSINNDNYLMSCIARFTAQVRQQQRQQFIRAIEGLLMWRSNCSMLAHSFAHTPVALAMDPTSTTTTTNNALRLGMDIMFLQCKSRGSFGAFVHVTQPPLSSSWPSPQTSFLRLVCLSASREATSSLLVHVIPCQ